MSDVAYTQEEAAAIASYRAKQSQAKGEIGEQQAHRRLVELGFVRVRFIGRVWKVTRFVKRNLAYVYPEKPLDADIVAMIPGSGRSVLAEVKTKVSKAGTLTWATIPDHQRVALTEHAQEGGISLLVWVNDLEDQIYVMQWPIANFGPGRKSLNAEKAAAANITSLADLV